MSKKPKTKAQLDRAADLRLKKTYNISLADYDYLLNKNEGKCWISGKDPGTRRLHVDHDHRWKKVTIRATKYGDTWEATGTYNGVTYKTFGAKKSLAVRDLKRKLLRASVRGLLSYSSNAGLQKFSDDPEQLRSAADYLENFQQGSPLSGREAE